MKEKMKQNKVELNMIKKEVHHMSNFKHHLMVTGLILAKESRCPPLYISDKQPVITAGGDP